MKKPWDRGFITPAAAGKPQAPWRGPATPEGWKRDARVDCVEFYRFGIEYFSYDRIVGRPGKRWRLWLNHGACGTFKAPDYESNSLQALLVWYAIETADRLPIAEAHSVTGRHVGKHAALAAAYGMSSGKIQAQLKGLGLQGNQADMLVGTAGHEAWVADFKALEERVCNQMTKP